MGVGRLGWIVFVLVHNNFIITTHTASMWLTVVLALFRYVVVCHPHSLAPPVIHPHSLAPRVASLSRTRLAVASVVAASVVLCSPNYFLYGPKSLSDRPGFWIDYNAIVVDEHKVTCSRLLPAPTEQYGGDDIAISLS